MAAGTGFLVYEGDTPQGDTMPEPRWASQRSIQLETLRGMGCRIVFAGQRATVLYPSSTTYEKVMYVVNQFPSVNPPHRALPLQSDDDEDVIVKGTTGRPMRISPAGSGFPAKEQRSSLRAPVSRALDRFRK